MCYVVVGIHHLYIVCFVVTDITMISVVDMWFGGVVRLFG